MPRGVRRTLTRSQSSRLSCLASKLRLLTGVLQSLDQRGDQGDGQGGQQEGVENAVADLFDIEGSVHAVHCRSPLILKRDVFTPLFGFRCIDRACLAWIGERRGVRP